MDNINSTLIIFVIIIVFLALIWWLILGPQGLFVSVWKKKIKTLEVAVRMHGDLASIKELRQIARLYERMGKHWEADKYYSRAIDICEKELGKTDIRLLPILKDYVRLLETMHYKKQVCATRDKIELINKQNK